MKRVLWILLVITLIIPFSINAKEEDINVLVDANIDISGNMKVREIISGSNNLKRTIRFKNSDLKEFNLNYTKTTIYNASNIEIEKVGIINSDKEDYQKFNEEVTIINECNNETSNCYKVKKEGDYAYIEVEGVSGDIYIEYLIANLVVIHNDIGELYYSFLNNNDYNYKVKDYKLRVLLPTTTKEEIKLWSHENVNSKVYILKEEDNYYGAYLESKNINSNSLLDIRMLFNKDLILIEHPFLKKSNIDAYDNIIKLENDYKKESDKKVNTIKYSFIVGLSVSYILFTIVIEIYLYLKFSKNLKEQVNIKDVEDLVNGINVLKIEYVIDGKLTKKTLVAIIIKLINDNIVSYKKVRGGYQLTLEDKEVPKTLKYAVNMIFKDSKKINLNTLKTNIESGYNEWVNKLKKVLKKELKINSKKELLFYYAYIVLGFIILLVHILFNKFNILSIIVLIDLLVYMYFIRKYKKFNIKGDKLYALCETFKSSIDTKLKSEYYLISYLLNLECENERENELIKVLEGAVDL